MKSFTVVVEGEVVYEGEDLAIAFLEFQKAVCIKKRVTIHHQDKDE